LDKLKELDGQDEKILTGDVLVTKNPCAHPGDVQKVTAVDYPELRHLYNVVVFPTVGNRPIQHMLSAGDLDGDTYMVIWDEDLVKSFKENHPPSAPEAVKKGMQSA
jgi:hypothetical protein